MQQPQPLTRTSAGSRPGSNTPSPRTPKKDYEIHIIPELDPNQKVMIPISPGQNYHEGYIFKAILKFLDSQNVHIVIVIADELRKYNFQIELGQDSHQSPIVKEMVQKLKNAWQEANLKFDDETQTLSKKLIETGKLKVLDWVSSKKEYQQHFDTALWQLREMRSEVKGNFSKVVYKTANLHFDKAMDGKYSNNSIVKAFRRNRGDAYLRGLYSRFIEEEATMMMAWHLAGFSQMAYPVIDDPVINNANHELYTCLTDIFKEISPNKHPMKFLTISYTPLTPKTGPSSPAIPGLRSKSSSEAATEEARSRPRPKEVIQTLKEEKEQLKNQLTEQEQKIKELEEQLKAAQEKSETQAKEKSPQNPRGLTFFNKAPKVNKPHKVRSRSISEVPLRRRTSATSDAPPDVPRIDMDFVKSQQSLGKK